MRISVIGFIILALLAGCQTVPPMPQTDQLRKALTGDFLAQGGAETLHAQMRAVSVPALGSDVIYLEWRYGDAKGKLQRQRLWQFVPQPGGGIAMRFFTFKDPAPYVGGVGLERVTPADLVGYPPHCDLPWVKTPEGARGAIPTDCTITARQSGKPLTLEAEITVSDKGFTYRESGRYGDGAMAFQVPAAGRYDFER